MKKLFLLMTMVVLSFGMTGCDAKQEASAQIEFYITANVPTDADITKIEGVLKSKNLPIGVTTVTVDGVAGEKAMEAVETRVKQIVADFLKKVTAAEINALNTGATTVLYTGKYPGSSSAIVIAEMDLK